jgi:hypothetical protein
VRKLFKRWWRNVFPQYILQVTHRGVDRRIHVIKFTKKTPKCLSGVNIEGESFELISTDPMDYYIEEYRDDLR